MKDKNKIMAGVLILFFCLRILYLDIDAPNYAILQYTRGDEGHYAMQAIKNVMHEEMKEAELLDGGAYETWNSSASFLNTVLCTATLYLFGRNFYGLRLADYIAGLISFLLLIKIIYEEDKKLGKGKFYWTLFIIGIGVLFNFPYLIACRFNDPGIFRILIIMCTLFYVWRDCNRFGEPGYFILGILSALNVVWGYATNVFVFVPAGILLLYGLADRNKGIWKKIGKMASGTGVGYVLGEACIYLAQGSTFTETCLRINQAMGEDRLSFTIREFLNNIYRLCMGNIFSYNGLFMVLAVISVVYVLSTGHLGKDKFRLYLAWLSVGLAIQSIFVNDTMIRKSIVIYPVLMLAISCLLRDCIEGRIRIDSFSWGGAICVGVIFLGCVWMCVAVKRLAMIEETDFSDAGKRVLVALNVLALCLFITFLLLGRRKVKVLAALAVLPMILPDIFLSCQYFSWAGYEDKAIMMELQELVGNNYVLGGYPFHYCLYNEMIPLSSTYDKFLPEDREERAKKLLQSGQVNYFLGNNEKEMINGWLEDTSWQWVLVKRFEETPRDYGGRREIYLYQKVLK